MNFEFVFENSFFVVMNKPAGVLSTPARFQEKDKRECLGTLLQEHLKIQIFPVHRLDFEVSGLVMYAKNADAHRLANGWFENKNVQKTYRARTTGSSFEHLPAQVKGQPVDLHQGQEYQWKCRLLRGKKRAFESPHGKDSLTIAKYIQPLQDGSHLWHLQPVTGRSHQLRYEMSRHGFPIVGDVLYGSKLDFGDDRIALEAFEIDFKNAKGRDKFQLPEKISLEKLTDFGA